MTDKVAIQPKSKPEKTTISISGETSERQYISCRSDGILRKKFVSLALDYFERTGSDLKKGNAPDYSPLGKIIGELKEVKTTMHTSNEGTEAVRQLLQAVREQTAKQLPALDIIAQAAEEKAKAESRVEEQEKNRRKNSDAYRNITTDCVTKSKICKPTRKSRTGNYAGCVMNKRLSGKYM